MSKVQINNCSLANVHKFRCASPSGTSFCFLLGISFCIAGTQTGGFVFQTLCWLGEASIQVTSFHLGCHLLVFPSIFGKIPVATDTVGVCRGFLAAGASVVGCAVTLFCSLLFCSVLCFSLLFLSGLAVPLCVCTVIILFICCVTRCSRRDFLVIESVSLSLIFRRLDRFYSGLLTDVTLARKDVFWRLDRCDSG